MNLRTIFAVAATASGVFGQLTPDQRAFEFQNVAALYARRYAPLEWKRQAIGFDPMNLKPWLERVRKAKNDMEYHEIVLEYVASFKDTHTRYQAPSSFRANLGVAVDIYDDKVLIESVDRQRYPSDKYPFVVGDELVSLDGKTVEEWMVEFVRFIGQGNPRSARRLAADALTYRAQHFYPRTGLLGDKASVEIRRAATGEIEVYELTWHKSNSPNPGAPSVRGPKMSAASRASDSAEPVWEQYFRTTWNWTVPASPLQEGTIADENGAEHPRRYVLGYGARTPVYQIPGFRTRLGRMSGDFHFSGTYEADGLRIGYLRIPNFSPPSTSAAIRELDAEIAYLNENTDGIVVDVTRNTGGGCYMLEVARRLMTDQFWFFGEQVRVTWDRVSSVRSTLEAARQLRAEEWMINTLEYQVAVLERAYSEGSFFSEPLPACSMSGALGAVWEYTPAPIHYTKPFIVLIDGFSTSAADIFPAMIQDNGRAPLVGTRTNGAGGSVSGWPVAMYSEGYTTNTNTMVLRKEYRSVEGYPASRYIENVGAWPDVTIESMTRENLTNGFRPFVAAFTDVLVKLIRTGSASPDGSLTQF